MEVYANAGGIAYETLLYECIKGATWGQKWMQMLAANTTLTVHEYIKGAQASIFHKQNTYLDLNLHMQFR